MINVRQMILLSTLNLYSAVCQLYLKLEEKIEKVKPYCELKKKFIQISPNSSWIIPSFSLFLH